MFQTQREEELEEDANADGSARMHSRKQGKDESRIRTLISFDKGGSWQLLKPPDYDSLGAKTECDSSLPCSLHLHGITNMNQYAPFYSMQSASGIILGTGNVGPYLRFEEAQTNTYISIDGGLTWIEAHKKPYIYEIGDHGGLLVMAQSTKRTKEVIFSWNEGMNW